MKLEIFELILFKNL